MITYLQEKANTFYHACVLRGRCGGIRNLFVGRKRCSTGYKMHCRDGESAFQTHILVKYSKGKYNHKRVKYFAYAVCNMGVTVQKNFKEYRKRFDIGSIYKLMNQSRARTSTKKPVLRMIYTDEYLDLLSMDLPQHTSKRGSPTHNLDFQKHVKTDHPKNRGKTRISRISIFLPPANSTVDFCNFVKKKDKKRVSY